MLSEMMTAVERANLGPHSIRRGAVSGQRTGMQETLAARRTAITLIAVRVAAPLGKFILSAVGTLHRAARSLNIVRSLHSGVIMSHDWTTFAGAPR